jgi:glutamyl-tRNA reductase
MISETKLKARNIYFYMVDRLAEGVYISAKDRNEMIKEIEYIIKEMFNRWNKNERN